MITDLIEMLFSVAHGLLSLFWWLVILGAVFTTLSSFGVLDSRNRMVWTIGDFLYRTTEPALRPIRRILPTFGNIDFSPLVLLLAIQLLQSFLGRIHFAIITGNLQGLLL